MAEKQLSSAKLEFVPNGKESNAAVGPKGPLPFRIGLNMAGAVSAGAYTAGVLDFLIEALDAWYEERERQIGLHGADISKWEVPAHDVSLEVLSGASAGGMCAAISAVSLQQQFDHVTTTAPVAAAPVNRLYDCWVRRIDNPNPSSVSTLGCQIATTVAPAWDNKIVPAQLDIVCADGGVTNNDPFECARQYLVRQAGGGPSDHNPRQATSANAAVISVAPFPGDDAFDPSYNAAEQSSLVNSILALIPTFLTQTRFQGESLSLIQNADVHSRFAIAPSDDASPALPSLLCGSLGAFGGFIDQKFRYRDYQLGRRNCQRFLEVYFVLPENNVIVGAGLPRDKDELTPEIAKFAVKPPPGVTTDLDKRWFPIIPLMPSVRNEVSIAPRTNFKTTPERIRQVAALAVTRTETVLRALLDAAQPPHHLLGFVVEAAFGLGGGTKLRNFVTSYLTEQLRNVQQL
jgi:hypothetical protein